MSASLIWGQSAGNKSPATVEKTQKDLYQLADEAIRSGNIFAKPDSEAYLALSTFRNAIDLVRVLPPEFPTNLGTTIIGQTQVQGDGTLKAVYQLLINPHLMSQLAAVAGSNTIYRHTTIAMFIKIGSEMHNMDVNPSFYASMDIDQSKWENMHHFDEKEASSIALAKSLAGRKVEATAVGFRTALEYFRQIGFSPELAKVWANSISNPWLSGYLGRLANVYRDVEGKTGRERELALKANIFEQELKLELPTLFQTITRIERSEKKERKNRLEFLLEYSPPQTVSQEFRPQPAPRLIQTAS